MKEEAATSSLTASSLVRALLLVASSFILPTASLPHTDAVVSRYDSITAARRASMVACSATRLHRTYKGFSFWLPLAGPSSSFLPALPPKSMYMRPCESHDAQHQGVAMRKTATVQLEARGTGTLTLVGALYWVGAVKRVPMGMKALAEAKRSTSGATILMISWKSLVRSRADLGVSQGPKGSCPVASSTD